MYRKPIGPGARLGTGPPETRREMKTHCSGQSLPEATVDTRCKHHRGNTWWFGLNCLLHQPFGDNIVPEKETRLQKDGKRDTSAHSDIRRKEFSLDSSSVLFL